MTHRKNVIKSSFTFSLSLSLSLLLFCHRRISILLELPVPVFCPSFDCFLSDVSVKFASSFTGFRITIFHGFYASWYGVLLALRYFLPIDGMFFHVSSGKRRLSLHPLSVPLLALFLVLLSAQECDFPAKLIKKLDIDCRIAGSPVESFHFTVQMFSWTFNRLVASLLASMIVTFLNSYFKRGELSSNHRPFKALMNYPINHTTWLLYFDTAQLQYLLSESTCLDIAEVGNR